MQTSRRHFSSKVVNGNSFLDRCQNVTGQLWTFVSSGDGYYLLGTKGGAAYVDSCQNVSGQLWKFEKH